VQIEKLLAEYARLKGTGFTLQGFFDDLFSRGLIPQSLLHWEMTGRREIE